MRIVALVLLIITGACTHARWRVQKDQMNQFDADFRSCEHAWEASGGRGVWDERKFISRCLEMKGWTRS